MPPNSASKCDSFTGVLNEDDPEINSDFLRIKRSTTAFPPTIPTITKNETLLQPTEKPEEPKAKENKTFFQQELVMRNVLIVSLLHVGWIYGLKILFTGQCYLSTFIFAYTYGQLTGYGITAGAHRLWAHRSYKARTPLKLLLLYLQSGAFQNSVYEWSRDHRVHHKFTETNADPHNANRGFFFAHMGWLLMRKHPDVKAKGKMVDLSDLEADPYIMFQNRHYLPVMILTCFIIPILVSYFIICDTLVNSIFVSGAFRYVTSLHMTWLVNSAAHLWGSKPYDHNVNPSENLLVAIAANGEGWHNYHHIFPWDYKTAEMGVYRTNTTTAFIDFFAMLGLAYDLKTVPEEIVRKRVLRTGDGTHPVWGWGDKDITKEQHTLTVTLKKKD